MVEWDGTVVLTTPRLLLRTFRRDGLPRYAALNADPEWCATSGVRDPRGLRRDRGVGPGVLRTGGLGLLAVERREDGAFLGMCGLHHQQSYPDDVEVAWRLAREHWGQGYATEAATAWLDHAFGPLGLPRVISITDRPNLRSLAVMRRLAAADRPQRELGRGGRRGRYLAGPQPGRGGDQLGQRQATKPGPQAIGGGHQQRLELVGGLGAGLDR